jgi:hypothetical protein
MNLNVMSWENPKGKTKVRLVGYGEITKTSTGKDRLPLYLEIIEQDNREYEIGILEGFEKGFITNIRLQLELPVMTLIQVLETVIKNKSEFNLWFEDGFTYSYDRAEYLASKQPVTEEAPDL